MTAHIRVALPTDARAVAAIHAERIGEGFLASLGPRFLARLYRRMAFSDAAVLLVAERTGSVVGFVAGTTSTGRLYRDFLMRDAVPAGLAALPAIVRAPRQVWETLRYGTAENSGELPAAEILSIAVATDATGEGTGHALLTAALDELTPRVDGVRVVTAVDNEAALKMYEGAGFVHHSRTEVHAGVAQEVLVWR